MTLVQGEQKLPDPLLLQPFQRLYTQLLALVRSVLEILKGVSERDPEKPPKGS